MLFTKHQTFLADLKSLIQENELDTALEQLLNFVKGAGTRDDYNTVVLIAARHHQLHRDMRKGILSSEMIAVSRARISSNLLDLIDDLGRKRTKLPKPPAPAQPIPIKAADFEKILGEKSNLKKIAWVEKVFEVEKSICRVVNGGYGTGFLIEGGWLLTNHHVIASPEEAAGTKVEFNFQEDAGGKMQPCYAYDLDAATFATDEEHDVTRVRVKPAPGLPPLSQWGFLKLSDKTPRLHDHVVIIQHPQGGPKQIALTDNKVINLYDKFLHYTTDTMPGSSGSPVFNDDWEVVGLHHAGGELEKNDRGDRLFANEAILVSHLRKIMQLYS